MLAYIPAPWIRHGIWTHDSWPSNSPEKTALPSARIRGYLGSPRPKKGKKQRSLTDSIPNKDSFFYVGFFIIIIYIYILHNIIYLHHFLLFPSLLYILHIIISVATDTETTTEFATIVRLLRLFITSPDVGFAHRMVEHG